MTNRRDFIRLGAVAAGGVVVSSCLAGTEQEASAVATPVAPPTGEKPIVLSTWNHGLAANEGAWKVLAAGGHALDAVEQGVMVTESDPEGHSVGLGGLPDRDGNVTLDACIMDENSRCGSVAFLQHIEHPVSVARKVMEETDHVMLVGEGALQFADEQGFPRIRLLTDEARELWEKWKKKSQYKPVVNSENHDTIGMVALDANGRLSGACTTSGMAYKLHGRVGDSPLIGAGLFVDGEVGAAVATGMGEAIIRVAGASTVVELMRQGASPEEACKAVVDRVLKKHEDRTNLQVGFLALNKDGHYGGHSVYSGFNYALRTGSQNEMINTKYYLEWE